VHRANRERAAAVVAGGGAVCVRCGLPIAAGAPLISTMTPIAWATWVFRTRAATERLGRRSGTAVGGRRGWLGQGTSRTALRCGMRRRCGSVGMADPARHLCGSGGGAEVCGGGGRPGCPHRPGGGSGVYGAGRPASGGVGVAVSRSRVWSWPSPPDTYVDPDVVRDYLEEDARRGPLEERLQSSIPHQHHPLHSTRSQVWLG
jgi:hypothetical protein